MSFSPYLSCAVLLLSHFRIYDPACWEYSFSLSLSLLFKILPWPGKVAQYVDKRKSSEPPQILLIFLAEATHTFSHGLVFSISSNDSSFTSLSICVSTLFRIYLFLQPWFYLVYWFNSLFCENSSFFPSSNNVYTVFKVKPAGCIQVPGHFFSKGAFMSSLSCLGYSVGKNCIFFFWNSSKFRYKYKLWIDVISVVPVMTVLIEYDLFVIIQNHL